MAIHNTQTLLAGFGLYNWLLKTTSRFLYIQRYLIFIVRTEISYKLHLLSKLSKYYLKIWQIMAAINLIANLFETIFRIDV